MRNLSDSRRQWIFLRYALLQPTVLYVQFVQRELMKDAAKTAAGVRQAIERQSDNPELYGDLMACIRMEK